MVSERQSHRKRRLRIRISTILTYLARRLFIIECQHRPCYSIKYEDQIKCTSLRGLRKLPSLCLCFCKLIMLTEWNHMCVTKFAKVRTFIINSLSWQGLVLIVANLPNLYYLIRVQLERVYYETWTTNFGIQFLFVSSMV